MGSYCSEAEPERTKKKEKGQRRLSGDATPEEETAPCRWNCKAWEAAWPRRGGGVTLEGYVVVESAEGTESGDGSGWAKSLTDGDLEELKGCLDLGFGFSYDEIPELCSTLPALQLCYSMSRTLEPCAAAAAAVPVAYWKISSPGDHPDQVKARLKFWAQAVACTVRLCR